MRKRSDGRWEGRYTAGYNPATGKRIIKDAAGKRGLLPMFYLKLVKMQIYY